MMTKKKDWMHCRRARRHNHLIAGGQSGDDIFQAVRQETWTPSRPTRQGSALLKSTNAAAKPCSTSPRGGTFSSRGFLSRTGNRH